MPSKSGRDVLLITLVDLLVQIIFVLLIAVAMFSPNEKVREVVAKATDAAKSTGKTFSEILDGWRRLVDADLIDKRVAKFLKQREDYERLLRLEKEMHERERAARDEAKRAATVSKQLEDRLGALGMKPCMSRDKVSDVVPLFKATITDGGIRLTAAWSQDKEQEVRNLPFRLERIGNSFSASEFRQEFKALFDATQKLQCRHYVVIDMQAQSGPIGSELRSVIERYFYPILPRS